jgi:[acyl-carrier-protein] S-malonyltransferase
MNKSCILAFPGQGSQYVGMTKNMQDDQDCQALLKQADNILGVPLTQYMLEGPTETLTLTKNAQPAIVLHAYLYWNKLRPIFKKHQIQVGAVLGHSVGEFSALLAAESLSLEQALKLTQFRGTVMQEAVAVGVGSMYAILRAPTELVEVACREVSNDSNGQWIVTPANYNSPEQVVISGHKEACLLAIEWLEKNFNGRLRTIELNVSAPFHCPLMKPAEQKFAQMINQLEIRPNQIPYYANVNAVRYKTGTPVQTIRDNFIAQISGSVLWDQSVQKFDTNPIIIEVGPSKVLQGLLKKSLPTASLFSLDQGLPLQEELEQLEHWIDEMAKASGGQQ